MILTLIAGLIGLIILILAIIIGIRFFCGSSPNGGRAKYYHPPSQRRHPAGWEKLPYKAPRVAMGQAPGSCSGGACSWVDQDEFARRREYETVQRLQAQIGEQDPPHRMPADKPIPVQPDWIFAPKEKQ